MKSILSRVSKYIDVPFSDRTVSENTEDELRRIRLVNYISLISVGNMLIYVLYYSLFDFDLFKPASVFLIIASLFTLAIIFINRQGKHLAAKILLSVVTPLSMSYTAMVIFGKAPGFQVYLFVAGIIPLFLWNYKQRVYPVIIISAILLIYGFIEFFPPLLSPKIILPDNYISFFRLTNVAVCFVAAGFAIGVYQFLYREKEVQLIAQAEELMISQAHKDKVYSIIAHDLRSPFGTFTKLTEIFIDEYNELSDENRLSIIQSMHHTSSSLQNLLENLLSWSRMQSGSLERTLEKLNLKKIAEESLALHRDLILKKVQKTKIDIDSRLRVYGDQHMVSTVFRNLISNASKFTEKNGSISIIASEKNKFVQVCVEDSGKGLSQTDLNNLFDIRNISKISGSVQDKGSGLGLLLCKDFVETQGGDLWVESELGRGSKFCFTLPNSSSQNSVGKN